MGFQLLEIPVSLSEVSNYLIKEGRKCYEKRQFDNFVSCMADVTVTVLKVIYKTKHTKLYCKDLLGFLTPKIPAPN